MPVSFKPKPILDIKTEVKTSKIHKIGLYLTVKELSTIIESLYETNKTGDRLLYTQLNTIMKNGSDAIKEMVNNENGDINKDMPFQPQPIPGTEECDI